MVEQPSVCEKRYSLMKMKICRNEEKRICQCCVLSEVVCCFHYELLEGWVYGGVWVEGMLLVVLGSSGGGCVLQKCLPLLHYPNYCLVRIVCVSLVLVVAVFCCWVPFPIELPNPVSK